MFEVKSLDDLINAFDTLRNERAQINYLDFHAHGYEANIGLENESITLTSLSRLRNKRYETMFAAGSQIRFLSCEFAGSAEGEQMLAEFAQILLRDAGGTAEAASGVCLYKPGFLFSGTYKHAGRMVTARVAPGGNVTLRGHFYLDPVRIRNIVPHCWLCWWANCRKEDVIPGPPMWLPTRSMS